MEIRCFTIFFKSSPLLSLPTRKELCHFISVNVMNDPSQVTKIEEVSVLRPFKISKKVTLPTLPLHIAIFLTVRESRTVLEV